MIAEASEQWVKEAIAEQEEHIKRSKSCREVVGVSHAFREFRNSRTGQDYQACIVCDVTASLADYEKRRVRSSGGSTGGN